ncbi:MAG: prepilin-type N-terminal cleavage/methylation domain-containing protein [Thermoanaerobaculum sp.]
MNKTRGFSLVELLVVLGVMALVLAVASADFSRIYRRGALRQAGFRLLTDAQRCQTLAIQHLAKVGLVFDTDHRGSFYVLVVDGNGNGVSRKDYLTGRDQVVGNPVYFQDFCPQVRLGLPSGWRVPQPGGGGLVSENGVQVGHAGILSFSPTAGATAGSVFLSSGSEVLALRVTPLGTARLFTWNAQRGLWEPVRF